MWVLVGKLWMNFGFYLNFQIFLDLDDDISIHSLTLIQGLVFMELQDYGHLRLVGHRQNKAFVYVLVVHVVTIRGAM